MTARIIGRGRGPGIEGTRITVYDVMDYWRKGWQHDQIAGLFRLPPDDIQEAVRYVEEHIDQVSADYEVIVERHRNFEYPPEVKDRLRRTREKFQVKLNELQTSKSTEAGHAEDHRGS
jgi:uncharacterized protein (DUF433 family)